MNIENQEYSEVQVGSNRSFGTVFFVVFAIIGFFPLLSDGQVRVWSLVIAALFLIPTLFFPSVLRPLNLLWFKFGMLLGRIVNPVVMFLIYALTVVPIGLLLRISGKDLLRLKFTSGEKSYWIERAPPGPQPESLEEQF